MSVQIQALIEALKGADPAVVRQLREAVNAVPQEVAPVNPCDHGHTWSDNRKTHTGKRVNRSCVHCGVLALHTGEAHGELEAAEASDDTATVAATVAALAPAAESGEPAKPVSSAPKKKRATG